MKSSYPENTSSNLLKYKPGRRFYVFIISLFLASGFWVLNALNKTYSEAVTLQIKYINLDDNQAFSSIPISKINVNLSGDGYSLVQLKNAAETDTLIIDLSTLEFKNEKYFKRAIIPTSDVLSSLKRELNNNIIITRVSIDSIEIVTEVGTVKELEIKPNFTLTLKNGMVLKRPVYCEPAFVNVSGPLSKVDELTELATHEYDLNTISEYTEVMVPLSFNKNVLIPEFNEVKLIAKVEALTEGSIEVPIQISGLPGNKRVRLLPNKVEVKYSTGLSHYDFVNPELFDVIVKFEDVVKNSSKVPVYVRTVPSYINVIQFYPEQVGYLKMDIIE